MTLLSPAARSRSHGDPQARGHGAALGGAGLGAALGVVAVLLMHRALGDDALITVSYARTLAESGTWGAFPGIPANTQTSPLNAVLLAAGVLLVGHPVAVAGALYCACTATCGALATMLASRLGVRPSGGWLAVAVVATSPVLVATVGLEACLGAVVLLGIAVAATSGRVVLTGLLCGAAVLTRPDLAVPAAVLALGIVIVSGRPRRFLRDLAVVVGVAALVALPWHVFSWYALGDAVPDTTWVRTGDRSGPTILPAVEVWLRLYPAATLGSVLPVLLAIGCAAWAIRHRDEAWARAVLILVAAGWAHLLALEAIHAQGAGWYYGPVVVCSAAALGIAAGAVGARTSAGATLGVVALAVAGVLTSGALPWTSAPLVANFASTEQYAAIARELGPLTGGRPVEGPGELGALAFHSAVPVLDFLSEPAQTDEVMASRAAEGGLRAELMRWSTAHRETAPRIPTVWRLSFGSSGPPGGRVVRTWPIDSPHRGADTVVLSTTG
ncbi:hypothetical protein WCD74_21645 [Actinomycetospora sp. OC33-EN08]|uniref:Glycosyltransferase RgtA/B/C/D-like domain-containing protein n=1 Tax=Actinomycetospora aurantiaca TaxID=3129233 RepID=A0ABU8MTU1_9PSEU